MNSLDPYNAYRKNKGVEIIEFTIDGLDYKRVIDNTYYSTNSILWFRVTENSSELLNIPQRIKMERWYQRDKKIDNILKSL